MNSSLMLDTNSLELQLLYSRDAEYALVGSVLLVPDNFSRIDIDPDDFYLRHLRPLWQAYEKLHKSGAGIDVTTVMETLDRMGKLAEVGGIAELADIASNGNFFSANLETHARIVKDYARRRAWLEVANRMARLAYDREKNLEQEAPAVLSSLSTAIRTKGAAQHVSQFTRLVLDEAYERMSNPKDIWGIPTGYIDFDHITGGLQPGEVLYLTGEPGVGKSMWAMQAAFQMAEKGVPGAIYSLEMPGAAAIRRRASHQSKIPARSIKTGRIADQFPKLVEALEAMDTLPLYISDDVSWTTTSLRADLARMKAQHGIRWFVLDYAYLLRDGIGLSENDRTGLISAQLKGICRALDLSGIVIMSMNKSGMGGLPQGENLRGNNQQFYDTDLLLFLIRSKDQPNVVRCLFGKGRELETPKQVFDLVALEGFPGFENAVTKSFNLTDYTV